MANKSDTMDFTGLTLDVGGLQVEGTDVVAPEAQSTITVAAYSAADISASYVEAEVQAVADQVEVNRDDIASIVSALEAAGILV